MPKHTHILNAASNLLGIALLLIAGLKVTRASLGTFADEIAWGAALCLTFSCLLSYLALRAEPETTRFERWADVVFLAGLLSLVIAVVVLAAFSGVAGATGLMARP